VRRLALPRLLALYLSGLAVAPHPGLCAQQGSKPEAKRSAQGESESPQPATELKEEAARQYQAGKYHQAIEIVERALQIAKEPEAHELRLLLARARSAIGVELFNAGENRPAEAEFHAALKSAEDSYAHFGLGMLSFVRLEDDRAAEHLAEAARLEPTYAPTQKLLAVLEYRQGHEAPALEKIREACRLDPKDAEARALLDRWTIEGRWAAAFRSMDRGAFVVRIDPELPAARVDSALALLEIARRDVAEALALSSLPARIAGAGGRRRIPVVLYSSDKFYKATGSRHWVGGYFDGQLKLPVPGGTPGRAAADDPKEREFREAVRHEMAHLGVREIGPECPNWLNEGLAQYLERTVDSSHLRELLRAGAARRVRFQDVPARLWEIDDEALARWTYLQGLGFVSFLAEKYQPFRLGLCLHAMREEGSVGRGFEVTYGETLEALEKAFWSAVLKAPGG